MSRHLTFLALAVLAVGASGCASSSGATSSTRSTRSPDVISRADIEASSTGTAYDLISRLRPQWLRTPTSVGSVSGGSAAMYGIVVYLDNVRLGGIETLRTVSTASVTSIRWLNAERAATSLPDAGREPIAGAIMISTR